jgi:type II secretory pathway pseudopilin PulG
MVSSGSAALVSAVSRRMPFVSRRRPPRGYTMVAVVMFIAILTILIAAVGPSISTIMRREREEELLFRGKQYARGIALFQRRYGRFPTSLKEMYENRPRSIRKLWKDPMCDCDDWKLLIQGQPDSTPFTDQNVDPSNRPPSTYGNLLRPTPTPGLLASGEEEKNVGPIIGVRSKSHQQALREWRGQRFYDQWRFIVGDADSDVPIRRFDPGSLRLTPSRRP